MTELKETPKDYAGNPVKEGDWVIRAYNIGRCAALKFSKVYYIKSNKLRLVSVEKTWGDNLQVQEGTMQFPDRVLVVQPSAIPETHRRLIDEYIESKEKTLVNL